VKLSYGGFVRKRRRVELHIERHEISIFAGSPHSDEQVGEQQPTEGAGSFQIGQTACPICGSPDLILLTEAVNRAGLDLARLNQGMQAGKIHFHRSNAGEWLICAKSLQQS
jgi:hypothetical protein